MSDRIPRLDFEELDPAVAKRLGRASHVRLPGRVLPLRRAPARPRGLHDFTEASKQGLQDDLVELIALTAATRLGNDYERHQHERLSVRLGLSREWIEAVERCRPEDLSKREAIVQRYVIRALDAHGRGVGEDVAAIVDELGPAAAMAVMMVLGRYVVHALIVNSLELAPPVPSIFEDGFE